METVQKEAQNVLVMMDINTLKRKTNVLVRMMPCTFRVFFKVSCGNYNFLIHFYSFSPFYGSLKTMF